MENFKPRQCLNMRIVRCEIIWVWKYLYLYIPTCYRLSVLLPLYTVFHIGYILSRDYFKCSFYNIKKSRHACCVRSTAHRMVGVFLKEPYITDVCLNFSHHHWLYKHNVSKKDCFHLQVNYESSLLLKHRVCIISDDGWKGSNTHQWYFACYTMV